MVCKFCVSTPTSFFLLEPEDGSGQEKLLAFDGNAGGNCQADEIVKKLLGVSKDDNKQHRKWHGMETPDKVCFIPICFKTVDVFCIGI